MSDEGDGEHRAVGGLFGLAEPLAASEGANCRAVAEALSESVRTRSPIVARWIVERLGIPTGLPEVEALAERLLIDGSAPSRLLGAHGRPKLNRPKHIAAIIREARKSGPSASNRDYCRGLLRHEKVGTKNQTIGDRELQTTEQQLSRGEKLLLKEEEANLTAIVEILQKR